MLRTTPIVRGDALVCADGEDARSVRVGTPDWYAWLATATTFSFDHPDGIFTARKERRQRGGWYWRAGRCRAGKLYHAYLGKSEALTLERLARAAVTLSARIGDGGAAPSVAATCERPAPPKKRIGRHLSSGASRPPARHPDEAQGELLVATKLLLPPIRPDFVVRPRLIEGLSDALQRKLILISAPAGSGKTTLLSQWKHQADFPIASVALDAADDDPARFWTYLNAAIRGLYPRVATSALSHLRSRKGFLADAAPKVLINALVAVPEDFVLVLDDYHTITSRAIHDAMNYLLDHLPPRVHLVIATRADPPLSLARLRGKGQMTELRSADLSFSLAEATAFLNQVMQLELSADDVAALGERTEGWAVGLQVAGLSLRGREDRRAFIDAFSGDHRHITDYLLEEVLGGLSRPVQDFLLQTSILDRLNAELSEAVTGQKNAQTMLEDLERGNLFTLPLDNARRWYRYHHLFADFLRARLEQTRPEEVPELHRRAGAWYATHDLTREAIGHALAAKDVKLAAAFVERSSSRFIERGEMITIHSWLRALPDELVRANPRLCISYAWALTSSADFDAAEAWVQEAERGLREIGSAPGGPRDNGETSGAAQLWDEAVALRAELATLRGDWPLAIRLGQEALERSSKIEAAVRSSILHYLGNAYWQVGDLVRAEETLAEAASTGETVSHIPNVTISLVELGYVQASQGRLRDAATTFRQALQVAQGPDTRAFWYAGWPHLGMARVLYEWNDLVAARHHAQETIELAQQSDEAALVFHGYSLLARLKQGEGDIDGALDLVRQAEHFASQSDLRREIPRLRAYEVRLRLEKGDLERVGSWVEESGIGPDDPPSYEHETGQLALAQVLLARGETTAALRLLERLGEAAETTGRMGSVIKMLVLQALAFSTANAEDQALSVLERALTLAEPEGYMRTFLDPGAPVAALLSRVLDRQESGHPAGRRGPSSEYVRRLLSAFDDHGESLAAPSPVVADDGRTSGVLSEREREVLHLLAAGRSAPDIARELVVTLNTVKTHRKNIYCRLDVHSRAEAVAKAKALHLL